MKIIIDSYIPYIKGALDDVAEVEYIDYKNINKISVKNADALIVRTRTHCNQSLLDGSQVKFIASATIGYDHVDADYCAANGIKWTNAPGCNALSVAQYIASALSYLAKKNNFNLSCKTMGIVGVGAVGSKIELLARSLGMKVLLNDPPRQRKEKENKFVSLDTVCKKADIITFHTLLNIDGEDKTFHLANKDFFEKLERKPIFINAARGEIVDTNALLDAIKQNKVSDTVLDCWEHEPELNTELLSLSTLATPHIAGYSADGKANAATQSVQSVSRFFHLGKDNWTVAELPKPRAIRFGKDTCVEDFYLTTYDIESDSNPLKENSQNFELQRSHYPFRREPKAYFNHLHDDFINKLGLFWKL